MVDLKIINFTKFVGEPATKYFCTGLDHKVAKQSKRIKA